MAQTPVTGEQNPGTRQVFQGGPEAGADKGNRPGSADSAARDSGQPDRPGQPKGNPRPEQSNDTITLPVWAEQLPKKLTADPDSAAGLAAFKTLEDFVQTALEERAKGKRPAVPGKDSGPQELQAFYESLGKPAEESGYAFAGSDPAFAKTAFGLNLTASQAEALYNGGMAQMESALKAARAALAKDFEATDRLLRKEYGESYDEAVALMARGLGNNPETGEMSPIAGALRDAGLAGKPEIVRAFIELGRATSEGAAHPGAPYAARPESVMGGRGFNYKDDYR